jgi:hypothetical protein
MPNNNKLSSSPKSSVKPAVVVKPTVFKKPPPPKPSAPKIDLDLVAIKAQGLAEAFTGATKELGEAVVKTVTELSLIPQTVLAAWKAVKQAESVAGKADDTIKTTLLAFRNKAQEGDFVLAYAPSDKRQPAWKAEAITQAAEAYKLSAMVAKYRQALKAANVNVNAIDVAPAAPFNADAYAQQVLDACKPSDKPGVQVVSLG